MNDSTKGLTSGERVGSAILSRAAPRRGYGPRSAAPAAARDRDRSRRPARPGRLAATVLVVGLVLLGAAAAEAQTSRILVSNILQTGNDSANTSGNDHAQLFRTGTHAGGYILTVVTVNSADVEDDDFDVEVCEEDGSADEFPSTTCTALTAPSDFSTGFVEFTHAGLALSANTNYVVVIKQRGTGSVVLRSTTFSGEDSQGLSGWSIKDKFYWKSGSTWMIKSGSNEALRIIVDGYETPAVTVTDATLSALSVSGATLSPAFDAATTTYSTTVANSVSQVTITETKSESTATVEYLDGSDATRTDADTMTAGLQVNLSVGSNIVKVKVTAPDTTTTKTYTVNVLRGAVPATCSVASMQNQVWTANLTVGTTTLLGSPIYGWNDGGGYTGASLTDEDFTFAGDTYDLEEIWVGGGLLTLAFNTTNPGDIATQATRNKLTFHVGSDSFNLGTGSLGSNQRTIVWSNVGLSWAASDSVCLALTEEVASTDATLSALALSGVTLSPAFDADTETYTASVANSVATTTVTAMATDAGATVAVTPSTDADAVTSGHQVNLGVGPTTITATVTAEDGMTTKTYTVVVTRAAQTCTVPIGGIWGACLTAATISSGSTIDASLPDTGLGCISTSCGDTSVLTSRDFSFGGKNYRIDAVDLRGGTLEFNLQTAAGDTAAADFSSVVLHVGTLSYSLASASFVGSSEAFAWTNTGLSWSANDKVALQLVELASTNAPPAFSAATATRSVPENSPASTNVGAPVTATDGDNDPLAYSLEGTAATAFEIVSTSGQIRTTAGETYDRETQSSYAVTVKADDGNGGTDTIAVTITLTNVIEPPGRPAAPSVSSVADSTTSLSVMWTAPENTGPAIDTYDLRYRQGTSGSWINGPQNVSGTSATISGLTANTLYQVQVLATSGEGGSPWSPSGSGQTNTAGNTAPTFSSPTASRSVPENSAAGTNVGAPVTATDADSGDTLTYTLDGTDAASFDIVSTSGQIQTRSGVTYDYETKSSYAVIVKAADGNGGSDTIMVTITVTDVDESPSPGPGPEPGPVPAVPLLGHLLLALGLTAAGARVIRRRPRVPPAA